MKRKSLIRLFRAKLTWSTSPSVESITSCRPKSSDSLSYLPRKVLTKTFRLRFKRRRKWQLKSTKRLRACYSSQCQTGTVWWRICKTQRISVCIERRTRTHRQAKTCSPISTKASLKFLKLARGWCKRLLSCLKVSKFARLICFFCASFDQRRCARPARQVLTASGWTDLEAATDATGSRQ